MASATSHVHTAELIEIWRWKKSPILLVSIDVLALIFDYLKPYNLCAVAQVCKVDIQVSRSILYFFFLSLTDAFCQRLNEVSSSNILWHQFCHQPVAHSDNVEVQWKSQYMSWLRPRMKLYLQGSMAVISLLSLLMAYITSCLR